MNQMYSDHSVIKCYKKITAPYVKLDTPLSDLSVVCRGCLAESGEMKNIREWGLMEDFKEYTGIQLRTTERLSELLCTTCEDSLRKCILFVQQCKQSDITLRNIALDDKRSVSDEENKITSKFNEQELIFTIIAPQINKSVNFPCPYSCNETYIKKNDILNHLVRAHKHTNEYTIDCRYYCWRKNCMYHENSGKDKYFSKRKYLNQHFNKVHKSKVYHCDICNGNFAVLTDFNRHHKTCNVVFSCEDCDKSYVNRERLLVHLLRHHPNKHKEYKEARIAEKRRSSDVKHRSTAITKKPKVDPLETDSPKRSFATQTLNPKYSVKNDVTLPSWRQTDETSTQTGFEDLLSLKSNSEDSLFYSDTALSDIQTQTFPIEFGLVVNRSHKETLTESLDLSMKATQTCFCYIDSSIPEESKNMNFISTETQTADKSNNDGIMSLNSTETQTCSDEAFKDSL